MFAENFKSPKEKDVEEERRAQKKEEEGCRGVSELARDDDHLL